MKRTLSRLFFLALGTVLAFAWGEAIVRVFKLAPTIAPIEVNKSWGDFYTYEYKSIRYLPKPDSPGINQDGFKDREFQIEKPARTFRIVLLGDSIVYGLCYNSNHIPVGERVSEKLEALLNSSELARSTEVKFEVLNFGVTGFDVAQEIDLFELKGAKYHPDLVIQVYCLNDDEVMSAEIDELRDDNKRWEEFRKWQYATLGKYLLWSDLYRFLYQRLGLLVAPKEPVSGAILTGDENPVLHAYRRLATLAEAGNFPVLIVTQPLIQDFINYRETWEHDRTRDQAKSQGFEFLDLLPAYRSRFGSNINEVSCGEVLHPNAKGHALMAEEIASFILQTPHLVRGGAGTQG